MKRTSYNYVAERLEGFHFDCLGDVKITKFGTVYHYNTSRDILTKVRTPKGKCTPLCVKKGSLTYEECMRAVKRLRDEEKS